MRNHSGHDTVAFLASPLSLSMFSSGISTPSTGKVGVYEHCFVLVPSQLLHETGSWLALLLIIMWNHFGHDIVAFLVQFTLPPPPRISVPASTSLERTRR